jgi:hypothetical protein
MKKIVFLLAMASMVFTFNACKKDKEDGGNPNPSATSCNLKSLINKSTALAGGVTYDGFVMYYDGDKISRANFIDSATGLEDKDNYALFSYNTNNLTDIKIYQDAALALDISFIYNAQGKIASRHFDLSVQGSTGTVDQSYFYDNNNNITYSVQKFKLDLGPFGKIENKDSGIFSNYNAKGRPEKVTIYRSNSTPQGDEPYAFNEELAYEYDANGNRTKESSKSDIADPFTVSRSATFDLNKTTGEAEKAYRLLAKINTDTWNDPNLDTKDIDLNLIITEISYDGSGGSETTNTTYTFNDKSNPASSNAVSPTETTQSTYTYECK